MKVSASSLRFGRWAFYSLAAAMCAALASLFTDGAGPCGSMAGFYCLFTLLGFVAIAGILFVLAFAQSVAKRIP